jgi:hypothetical protein
MVCFDTAEVITYADISEVINSFMSWLQCGHNPHVTLYEDNSLPNQAAHLTKTCKHAKNKTGI